MTRHEDVLFRRASMADRGAIEAMVRRCSPDSRYARFLAPVPEYPADLLTRALSPESGDGAWLATRRHLPEAVVALGSWSPAVGGAEVALLVEDSWQRCGIGTALLDTLVANARDLGVGQMHATMLSESRHVLRMLRLVARRLTSHVSRGVREVRLELVA